MEYEKHSFNEAVAGSHALSEESPCSHNLRWL